MISGLDRLMFVCRCTQCRLDPRSVWRRPRWFTSQRIVRFSVYRHTHDNSVTVSKMFLIPRRAFIPHCLRPPAGSGLASKCFSWGYF